MLLRNVCIGVFQRKYKSVILDFGIASINNAIIRRILLSTLCEGYIREKLEEMNCI